MAESNDLRAGQGPAGGRAPQPGASVLLFGPPRLLIEGLPVAVPPALAPLLGYLAAAAGQRVARSRLAGVLWPDVSEPQARRMLTSALYRLRRLLGSAAAGLASRGEDIILDAAWVDLQAFRQLAASQRPDDWAGAIELYQPDLLAEHDAPWLEDLRAEIHHSALAVLERAAAHAASGGDAAAALAAAGRWAAADPLNESAHMMIMRLHGRVGRYSAALQQYERLATLLEAELGLAPLPETRQLADQLRRELEVAQARAAAERQRSGRQPFVGRIAERALMMEALEQALAGQGGLMLVEGEPGIGKTRLLDEFAAAAQWRGFQIAWGRASDHAATPYAPLDQALAQALAPGGVPAGRLLAEVSASALEALAGMVPHLREAAPAVSAAPARPNLAGGVAEGLLSLTAQAPALLLLDDVQWASPAFWHAIDFSQRHSALLRRRPLLLVLAYRPLELAAHGYGPAAEALARAWQGLRLPLAGLSSAEVRELVTLLRSAAPAEVPVGEVTALYRLTDGNPLYVLESELSTPHAPQPFAALIDGRLAALSAAARAAVGAAAVLGRDWPLPLWQAVAQAPVAAAVDELCEARLIQPAPAGYCFRHELIRSLILQTLPAAEQRRLHGRAVRALGAEPATPPERIAWHCERAGDHGRASHFYRLAGEQAFAHYAYSSTLAYLNQGLALLGDPPGQPTERLALLCARQRVLGVMGQFPAWRADVDAIERLAAECGDHAARLEAMEARIVLLAADSDVDAMRAVAEEAAALAQRLRQPLAEARIWRSYGFQVLSSAAAAPATTLPMLRRAVTLSEQAGDRALQVAALCTLAFAECLLGQTSSAQAHAAQALTLIELDPGLAPARGDVLRILAQVALNRGDWESARSTMHKALQLLEEQDDKWPLTAGLAIAVFVFGGMGQHGEARAAVGRMRELLRQAEVAPASNWGLYTTTVALESAMQSGDFAAAEALIAGLGGWLETQPKAGAGLYLLLEIGAAKLFQNRPRAALPYLRAALPLWYTTQAGFLPVLLIHALAAQLAGEPAEALASMQEAERYYSRHELAFCAVLYHFTRFWVHGKAADLQAAYAELQQQAGRIRDPELRAAFLGGVYLHTLVERMWRVRSLAPTIRSMLGVWRRIASPATGPEPADGAQQLTVSLAQADAPLGVPLRDDQRVAVVWTIHAPGDEAAGSPAAQRQRRLRRLLDEAAAQGAAPTDDDLAGALGVSRRTIIRDMRLLEEAGVVPATRRRRA